MGPTNGNLVSAQTNVLKLAKPLGNKPLKHSRRGRLYVLGLSQHQSLQQGSKIRNTYIKWAQGEKTRLLNELTTKRGEVKSKEVEVQQLKGQLCALRTPS
jgi:hypothetical protein